MGDFSPPDLGIFFILPEIINDVDGFIASDDEKPLNHRQQLMSIINWRR